MNKKIVLPILLSAAIGLGGTSYAKDNYDIYLNDKEYKSKEIIELDGLVYLPLRDIVETLNYKVKWNNKDKSVRIQNDKDDIELFVNNNEIKRNGKSYKLKGKNYLKDTNTYSPIDLFGQHMDIIGSYKEKSKDFYLRNPRENNIQKNSPNYDDISERIDEYLIANVKAKNFHGSVLSAKDDNIIINKGYSFANLENSLNNKTQTKFSIGSISKQFTAVGILKLYENQKIDLNETINKYLPNIKYGDKITIHQLLTHSSGLVNYTDQVELYSLKSDEKIYDEILNIINKNELIFKPGSQYQYSNTNYLLLADIIEEVSGLSYEEYMTATIFKPLKMMDTGVNYGEGDNTADATGYVGYLDVEVMDDEFLQKTLKGAGNIYSTTEDMFKWSRALDEYKIISEKTTEELLYGKHISVGGNNKVYYGYGFMIFETKDGPIYMHDGQTFGFTSLMVKYPKDDLVNIILVNNRLYDVSALEADISKIINLEKVENPTPIKAIDLEEEKLEKILGKYNVDANLYIEMKLIDDKLMAELPGQPPYEITYMGENKFILRKADASIELVEDHGEINKLIFRQLGLEYIGKKENKNLEEIVKKEKIDFTKYIGEYKLDMGHNISIFEKDEKLFAKVEGQSEIEIEHDVENKFDYLGLNIQLEFYEEKDEKMQGIKLFQLGQTFEGKRNK